MKNSLERSATVIRASNIWLPFNHRAIKHIWSPNTENCMRAWIAIRYEPCPAVLPAARQMRVYTARFLFLFFFFLINFHKRLLPIFDKFGDCLVHFGPLFELWSLALFGFHVRENSISLISCLKLP